MTRMLNSSNRVKGLLEEVSRRRPMSAQHSCHQLCTELIATFYHDLYAYLVVKGHWHKEAPCPRILSQEVDCAYDVDNMVVRLANPLYNAKVTSPSVVHPKTGPGRRSITSRDFLDRWFTKCPSSRRAPPTWDANRQSKWFFCTMSLLDFIQTNLDEASLKAFRDLLSKTLMDTRRRQQPALHRPMVTRPAGALVPDGTGPRRPFRTLNSWVEVVGGETTPFVSPHPMQNTDRRTVPVTRTVLNQEYEYFAEGSRRGFTEHELNVFSMFVLLEGGEDRLNNVTEAPITRTHMGHMDAFLEEGKATLYCFRVRRTVQQITEKFNAACKSNVNRSRGWSLREIVERLQRCLGTEFLGQDGRINKEAAHRWLVTNQARTRKEYRAGFRGGLGPLVKDTNRAAWEAHTQILWSHPIPIDLLPWGSAGPNETGEVDGDSFERDTDHTRDLDPVASLNPDGCGPGILPEEGPTSTTQMPHAPACNDEVVAELKKLYDPQNFDEGSSARFDEESSIRNAQRSFFENESAFE